MPLLVLDCRFWLINIITSCRALLISFLWKFIAAVIKFRNPPSQKSNISQLFKIAYYSYQILKREFNFKVFLMPFDNFSASLETLM